MFLLTEIEKNNMLILDKKKIYYKKELNIPDFTFIDLDINNKINKKIDITDIDNNQEFNIIFNNHKYFNNILITYKYDWENIYEQIIKDFHRIKMSINNVPIDILDMYIKNEDFYKTSINSLALMLFNQSSLGYPMEKIIEYHNLYNDYMLIDSNESVYINVITNGYTDKNKIININKRLKIIYPTQDYSDYIDKYYVDIKITFHFENIDTKINLKQVEKYIEKFNILEWNISLI